MLRLENALQTFSASVTYYVISKVCRECSKPFAVVCVFLTRSSCRSFCLLFFFSLRSSSFECTFCRCPLFLAIFAFVELYPTESNVFIFNIFNFLRSNMPCTLWQCMWVGDCVRFHKLPAKKIPSHFSSDNNPNTREKKHTPENAEKNY